MHIETQPYREQAIPGGWAAFCEYARREVNKPQAANSAQPEERAERDAQLPRS
jgi:hypothetical protein